MEPVLNAQFDRIETALNTLIDSITTYNPSPAAAQDLLAIDDDLSRSLEQLSTHQSNHAHILALRRTASTLESQIKGTLASLVSVRKELLATPAAAGAPAQARDVPLHELLAYARRLAKFTVPPSYRPPPADDGAALPRRRPAGVAAAAAAQDARMANGVGGSPATGAVEAEPEAKPEEEEEEEEVVEGEGGRDARGAGWAALSAGRRDWLETMKRLPFVPWPSEEVVWSGALADVQRMRDDGRDPAAVLGAEQQEALEATTAEEERERVVREEEEEERRRGREAGGGVARGGRVEQVDDEAGGLDLYDPDEE